EKFAGAQNESKQKVEDLTDAMKEQNAVVGQLTAQNLAETFQEIAYGFAESTKFTDDLKLLGVSLDDVILATLEGEDAIVALGREMMTTAGTNKDLQVAAASVFATMQEEGKAVEESKAEFDAYNASVAVADRVTKNAGVAMDETGLAAQGLEGDFSELDSEIRDANDALANINEMFSDFDANVAAIRAKDELGAYYRDINEEIAANNRSLTGNGKAAMKNRDAVLDALNLAKQDAQAWGEANNATLAQVEDRFQSNTDTLKKTLEEQGFSQEEIEIFFGSDYVDAAGVAVQGQMSGRIGTMADQLGSVALREFKGVGRDLGNGLAAGIRTTYTTVEGETTIMINRAEAAARRAAQTGSPSKVFAAVGEDLMAGLEKGIRDSSDEAAEAARDAVNKATTAATDAIQEWEDYRDSVQDAIVGTLDLGQAYQDYTDRQQAVTDALAELHEYQAEVQGDATDAQKDKLKELQTAYQEAQADAANGAQSIVDEFVEQGKKAAAFTTNLHTLLNNNLSRRAFDAIIREGGERGADIAAALVEGNVAENVRRVNEVYGSVSNMGKQVGTQAADSFYGSGVSLALEALTGIIKEFLPGGKKRKELLRAVRNLDKSIRFEPKYLDIVTRRYEIGQTPPTIAPEAYAGAAASADVASQFSQSVLNNAQRLNAAHQAGQDVTQLGFNQQDWQALAELERANIAALATGGIVTAPTMALIGEAGPEAVVPLSGRNAPAMGNTTVNVTINAGMGTDGAEVGRQVVEAVRKYERRSGPVFARA
ncbi:MAG TPA: hypothetical protein VIG24_04825, partial [Acidimicrobiia bacterium]